MASKIIAIDVGTSSTKVVLFDHLGQIESEAQAKHVISAATPGRQEQQPHDWWESTMVAVRNLDGRADAAAIVLSGTMQNVIALDSDGEPLRPAILYSDSRASAQYAALLPALNVAEAHQILGNAPNELMAAFKMRWLIDNEPNTFARVATLHSGAKDYIIYRLTGVHVTDPTAASTVGLMDLKRRAWCQDLLPIFGVQPQMLPKIVSSRSIVGRLTARAAQELRLSALLPVINGLGDAGASTIGAQLNEVGEPYINLGTTTWVARVSGFSAFSAPAGAYALAHPIPNKLIEVVPLLSGGDCIEWLHGALGADFNVWGPWAAKIDACPSELLFLPYLKGERSPAVDTALRGAFLMIDRSHGQAEMFYAMMEGVALLLHEIIDTFDPNGDSIKLLGGGALNEIWPQLIADATTRSIKVARHPGNTAAFGAYLEAASALGWPSNVKTLETLLSPREERLHRTERRRSLFRAATTFVRSLSNR